MTTPRTSNPMTSYLKFNEQTRVVIDEKLSSLHGCNYYCVNGCMTYYVDERDKEYWVNIPHGYRVNGTVIPRIFSWLLQPNTEHGKSVILLHYLRTVGKVRIKKVRLVVGRRESSRIFMQAMKVSGVGFFKRWLLYCLSFVTFNTDATKQEIDALLE